MAKTICSLNLFPVNILLSVWEKLKNNRIKAHINLLWSHTGFYCFSNNQCGSSCLK